MCENERESDPEYGSSSSGGHAGHGLVWRYGVCAYLCVPVNYDSSFVPMVVTSCPQSLQEFRSFLAARGGFRQCLEGG